MADQNPNTPHAPAVENFVEQKPEQNPVDKIASDIGLPQQPNDVPAPATPENQVQTQENVDKKAQNEKIFSPDRIKNLKKQGFSDSDAHQWIIREQRRKSKMKGEKEEKQIQETRQQSTLRRAELTDELIALDEDLNFAEQQGYDSAKLIEKKGELTQEKDGLDRALEPVTPATEDDVAKATTPTISDVKQAGEQVRRDTALNIAKDEEQKQKIQDISKKHAVREEEIEREDLEMKAIDPDRFWNNKSVPGKITAALSIILGGMAGGLSGQGGNVALEVLNNAIDNDIKSQKLNNDQTLAKKKHALSLVELQLKRLEGSTNNQLKKVKIQSLISDMQQGQLQLQQKRLMTKKIASADGLTREEILALPAEQQKKVIPLGNRNFIAFNPEVAKKINVEVIPNAKASLRGLDRLKEILDDSSNQINPVVRGEVDTIVQSLKGSLRLELFGPGVMTDFENNLASKIIGNPNKILAFSAVERAKLNVLVEKIKNGTRDKIAQAGVPLPKSDNEKAILQMQKNNPKMKRTNIINSLIHNKLWKPAEGLGF